jgi:uncharacterized protein (TIGR02145 family)
MGAEERALVTEVSATGATASTVTGHRGFWLETAGSNGSATVTAILSLADGVENFNWCVYAFDYPPNAVFQSDGSYRLHGSPPFTINGYITEPTNTFVGTCIVSITDATDNPEGIVPPPPIAWSSGGEASQDVLIGNAVTPIIFTTAGATSITPADLPDGVSGAWSSPDYIVSGTPSGTGTYNYTLTATDVNGCSATVSGTITVMPPGVNQQMGGCTFMQPELIGTFAHFPATYSASTFVMLQDERDRNNYTVVNLGGRWIMSQNLNYQTGLIWQANSNAPSTVSGFNPDLIGHFWCPGAQNATSSSRASCDVWGALYSWETAMMRDGKYAGSTSTDTSWPGDAEYCNDGGCTNTMNQGGRGICPPNWHVPTQAEWGDILNAMEPSTKNHNSGSSWRGAVAGTNGKAKCTCASGVTGNACAGDATTAWLSGAAAAGTDNYGFRSIPSGRRILNGATYEQRGQTANFWSASPSATGSALFRGYNITMPTVYTFGYNRAYGMTVRCIID